MEAEQYCDLFLTFPCILCSAAEFSNEIFRLNTSSPSPRWEDMTPGSEDFERKDPLGTYRIQNAMVAVNGTLLIYGGASSRICPPLQYDAGCDCYPKREHCLGCTGLRFLWLLSVALCCFTERRRLHVPSHSKSSWFQSLSDARSSV